MGTVDDDLEVARAAAITFATSAGLGADHLRQLAEPPLFGPVPVDRNGRTLAAYRWLGGGRGAPYLQAEVDREAGVVTILSGEAHQERTPATYPIDIPRS